MTAWLPLDAIDRLGTNHDESVERTTTGHAGLCPFRNSPNPSNAQRGCARFIRLAGADSPRELGAVHPAGHHDVAHHAGGIFGFIRPVKMNDARIGRPGDRPAVRRYRLSHACMIVSRARWRAHVSFARDL